MDVEKTSKDLVDECKVVSCEKERESGFCFQKYSKDEISEFFMVWFTGLHTLFFRNFRNFEIQMKISIFWGHFFCFTPWPQLSVKFSLKTEKIGIFFCSADSPIC